jgi:hypothetical protein
VPKPDRDQPRATFVIEALNLLELDLVDALELLVVRPREVRRDDLVGMRRQEAALVDPLGEDTLVFRIVPVAVRRDCGVIVDVTLEIEVDDRVHLRPVHVEHFE